MFVDHTAQLSVVNLIDRRPDVDIWLDRSQRTDDDFRLAHACMAFDHVGHVLAFGHHDLIEFWSWPARELLGSLTCPGVNQGALEIGFSPDGEYFAAALGKTTVIYRTKDLGLSG